MSWTGFLSDSISIVLAFTGLRQFPTEVIRTFRAFFEFCYKALCSVWRRLPVALTRFHRYRSVFDGKHVREGHIAAEATRPRALPCFHTIIWGIQCSLYLTFSVETQRLYQRCVAPLKSKQSVWTRLYRPFDVSTLG